MTDTPSGMSLMDYPQLNGEYKFNELVWRMELMWRGIKDRDLASPPGSPSEGDAYLVYTGADGDWLDHDDEFAVWRDGAWHFTVPVEGNIIRVNDEDIVIHYNGSTWSAV